MQRYDGRDLGPTPHIAVLGSSKVGNFVVTVPLLRGLRSRFPDAVIDFWGSELTADFELALPCINWRTSWDRPEHSQFQQMAAMAEERVAHAGPHTLVINCDGFNPVTQVLATWLRPTWVAGACLSVSGRTDLPWGDHPYQRFLADPDWDSEAFLERYPGVFRSNYIAELLCRLAYVEPEVNQIELPSEEPGFFVPDVLVHCTTTRAAKIWPFSRWRQVLDWCFSNGVSVGLIGSAPKRQQDDYHAGDGEASLLCDKRLHDLRGRTSLIQLAGACRKAKAVISVDAGPLHIAAAVGVPTLAVVGNDAEGVGSSPVRLWMPRSSNCSRTVSEQHCDGCASLRFRNNACVREGQPCMEGVDAEQVINWLKQQQAEGLLARPR